MNGQTIFNAVIGAMFTIILGMAGYIATQAGHSADDAKEALSMRIDAETHRLDRVADRVNELDRRLAIAEFQLKEQKP
jgi:hypothetical protein